jgi:predicted HicB family RNase H-like nuclease
VDTAVWFQALLAGASTGDSTPVLTKDRVYDEALQRFLQRRAGRQAPDYERVKGEEVDLTFWVDTRLLQRARLRAAREGVRLAQLIGAALSEYVATEIPARVVRFRRQVEQRAVHLQRLLRARGGAQP